MAIEQTLDDYIVSLFLLKTLEAERRPMDGLRLSRVWLEQLDRLSRAAERAHVAAKRQLRRSGCKIVLQELLTNRSVHVMYVYRGYEHHCTVMPFVLKGKCETKLRELLAADGGHDGGVEDRRPDRADAQPTS